MLYFKSQSWYNCCKSHCLFRSCPIVRRTLLLHFPFKLTLSRYYDLFLCILSSRLFAMLCIVIYYKEPAVSDNKHELIQVVVTANVTTHKKSLNSCEWGILQNRDSQSVLIVGLRPKAKVTRNYLSS